MGYEQKRGLTWIDTTWMCRASSYLEYIAYLAMLGPVLLLTSVKSPLFMGYMDNIGSKLQLDCQAYNRANFGYVQWHR